MPEATIATSRAGRRLQRIAALVGVIALLSAIMAPPLSACEAAHANAAVAGASVQSHGANQAAHESDCTESEAPALPQHDSDCLAVCLSMVGCSAPSFVTEAAQLSVIAKASRPLAGSTPLHPSRSSAPDRPPPRS